MNVRHPVAVALLSASIVNCAAAVTPAPSPPASVSVPSLTPPVVLPSPSRTPAPPVVPLACEGRDPRASSSPADNQRWLVSDACAAVSGTVRSAAPTANGDLVLVVSPDYRDEGVLAASNITRHDETIEVRVICAASAPTASAGTACSGYTNRVIIPTVGAHVAVRGALTRDATDGANAIRPAWEITPIATPAIPAPLIVLQTKKLWTEIRAVWPMIPPAVVVGEENPPVYASAALYADGLSHVFIRERDVYDPHQIWHEAGHILHAVAMLSRGQRPALFTPLDTVGAEFWTARGLPGRYADTLDSGNWLTLPYEELAECFSAVNTGDKERAETYGVPLDRATMRAFFTALASRMLRCGLAHRSPQMTGPPERARL